MTKLLGVCGDPIAHSLSPLIHNGWLRDMGFDATYEAFHIPDGEFQSALKTLEERDILGLNVTLPHKAAALSAASEVSVAAAAIGAANSLTHKGGGLWHADNTDAPGFLATLGAVAPKKDRAMIFGAGGSARAIVFALTNEKIPITILNRTESKARDLCEEFGDASSRSGSITQYREYIAGATILINTTSMGYSGDTLDLPDGDGRIFYDISYGKISENQLAHANQKGWKTKDGLDMLVAQAAFSFESWFGELPDFDRALKRCKQALKAVS